MPRTTSSCLSGILLACALAGTAAAEATEPAAEAPGREKTTKTNILEMGAGLMQRGGPTGAMDIYLDGFHPLKEDPQHQLEAHHFCRQVNEDFAQCTLFDGNTEEANLNGIEYIISERLYERLPEEEKAYWHPHNGEILSGQLVAPGLPDMAEKQLMRTKMNSYGKTWHTWDTSGEGGADATLPLGDPKLAWSFNHEGEAKAELIEKRDQRLGIDTEEKRRRRQDLVELAHPQDGVDALKGKFSGPTEDIPGVVDKKAAQPSDEQPAKSPAQEEPAPDEGP